MCYLFKLYSKTAICLFLTLLVTHSARAEDEDLNKQDRGGNRGEMRQRMLEEFDADGDGELSEGERTTARQTMRSRRGDKAGGANEGKRLRDAKGRLGAKGRSGAKGPAGAKQGGRGLRGPDGPPDPAALFDQYDANGDGQLSREEFTQLTAAVRASRPPQGAGRRGGERPDGPPRAGRDGPRPDGPPRVGRDGPRPDGPPHQERRRRFEGQRPLQNPGDRPGPRPRREGRRRFNSEEVNSDEVDSEEVHSEAGHHEDGPRAGDGDLGRPGQPDPARIFERFDENGDDQLSREEFMKLADRMREMRDRRGLGGERGESRARGARRGPPGENGAPGSRRPQRPEMQRPEMQRPEMQRPESQPPAPRNPEPPQREAKVSDSAVPNPDDSGAKVATAADDNAG